MSEGDAFKEVKSTERSIWLKCTFKKCHVLVARTAGNPHMEKSPDWLGEKTGNR